jgi:GPI-anchor transamidase subunit K
MLLNWFLTLLTLSAVTALDYEDNIYVVLSSSKFFFNYRHSLNAFQFYSHLKQSGITDDKIMLMVPTDHGCNPKNIFPGTLYHEVSH